VAVVTRGGGSAEDLWEFNDERLARFIAACPVPVVSAVGHEVDVTVADLVADVRAATPTHAAELVVPVRDDLSASLAALRGRLVRAEGNAVEQRRRVLRALRAELSDPRRILSDQRRRLDDLVHRGQGSVSARLRAGRARVASSAEALRRREPRALLQASLPAGARDEAEFARGRILIDSRGWRDPGESVACLPVLLDALWRGRQVRFRYSSVLGEASDRCGDALGLVAKGSVWYLVASVGGEAKTYRVSRISEVVILNEPSARPAEFDLTAYWERSAAEFREKLPRYYATFLANPAVMRWVRYRGWRLEEEAPDGDRVRVRLRFDVEEEAVQFALSFGGDVEVMEPLDLRGKVLAGALAIVTRYQA
jgi:predicted DNA-binding transcriptional regulator YafY